MTTRTAAARKAAEKEVAKHHSAPAPVKSVEWLDASKSDPLHWPMMLEIHRRTARTFNETVCDFFDNALGGIDFMSMPLSITIDIVGYDFYDGSGNGWILNHDVAEIWITDNSCGIALADADTALAFGIRKNHPPGTPKSRRIHAHGAGMKTGFVVLGQTASSVRWVATKTDKETQGHVFSYVDPYDLTKPVSRVNIYSDDGSLTDGKPVFDPDGPRGPDGQPVFGSTEQGTQIRIVGLRDIVPARPATIRDGLMPALGRTYAEYLCATRRSSASAKSFLKLKVRMWGRIFDENGTFLRLDQLNPNADEVGPIWQKYRKSSEGSRKGLVPPTEICGTALDIIKDPVFEKYHVRFAVEKTGVPGTGALIAEFVFGVAAPITDYAQYIPKGVYTALPRDKKTGDIKPGPLYEASKHWGIAPYGKQIHTYGEAERLICTMAWDALTGIKTGANHNIAFTGEIHLLNSAGIELTAEKNNVVPSELWLKLVEAYAAISNVLISHWAKYWSSPDTASKDDELTTATRAQMEEILVRDLVINNYMRVDPRYPHKKPRVRWAGSTDGEMCTVVGRTDIVVWDDYGGPHKNCGLIQEAAATSINSEKIYQALRYRDEVLTHPVEYPEVDPSRLVFIGFATKNGAPATHSGFRAVENVKALHPGLEITLLTWEDLGYDDAKIQSLAAAAGIPFVTTGAYREEDADEPGTASS